MLEPSTLGVEKIPHYHLVAREWILEDTVGLFFAPHAIFFEHTIAALGKDWSSNFTNL